MEDFSFKFSHGENNEYVILIYDKERKLCAMVQGADFSNVLKHALYSADPHLAAAVLGESFLKWTEDHDAINLRKKANV